MIICIKVTPNAKRNEVILCGEDLFGMQCFKVKVNQPVIDNMANNCAIKLLAEYFNTQKDNIKIIKGNISRTKIIKISI